MASISGISEVDTPEAYRLSERAVRPTGGNGTWREEDRIFSFSSLSGLVPTVTRWAEDISLRDGISDPRVPGVRAEAEVTL